MSEGCMAPGSIEFPHGIDNNNDRKPFLDGGHGPGGLFTLALADAAR
jgi:hypothetical protein